MGKVELRSSRSLSLAHSAPRVSSHLRSKSFTNSADDGQPREENVCRLPLCLGFRKERFQPDSWSYCEIVKYLKAALVF
jgi:hypothetical protein